MKPSFTTLGSPGWSLDEVCQNGSAAGFEGVDFRGLQDNIDITTIPEFTAQLGETKRKLGDAGLAVCGISTSIGVCEPDNLETHLEEAKRTIPVARELNVPCLRVFGRGNTEQYSKEELADIGQETMQAILALDGAREFRWVFETHDHWIASGDCKLLLDRIPDAEFGALWDMGHTARVGGEAPGETLEALGDRVYYTHVKDAVYDTDHPKAMEDGWRYVTPGMGQLPLAEAVELLKEKGYDGWIMFEHEKRWHPELAEPEDIFPEFVSWFRGLGL